MNFIANNDQRSAIKMQAKGLQRIHPTTSNHSTAMSVEEEGKSCAAVITEPNTITEPSA